MRVGAEARAKESTAFTFPSKESPLPVFIVPEAATIIGTAVSNPQSLLQLLNQDKSSSPDLPHEIAVQSLRDRARYRQQPGKAIKASSGPCGQELSCGQ